MLNDSEFKPFSLTDFTVAEAPPEKSDSSSASNGDGEAEIEDSEISDRRVSFKSLMFEQSGWLFERKPKNMFCNLMFLKVNQIHA